MAILARMREIALGKKRHLSLAAGLLWVANETSSAGPRLKRLAPLHFCFSLQSGWILLSLDYLQSQISLHKTLLTPLPLPATSSLVVVCL